MPIANEFEVGLRLFGLDPKCDADRRAVWVVLGPHIEEIAHSLLSRLAEQMPAYSKTIEDGRAGMVGWIIRGTGNQFVRPFDETWLEETVQRIQFEQAHGFDIRSRPAVNRLILSMLSPIMARRHRFSGARAARLMDVATRVLNHDCALAANYHYSGSMREARRTGKALTEALDQFDEATSDVRRSVSSGAQSLHATAEELRRVFDSIGGEAERAARASEATAGNVEAAASATEDLSAAIVELEGEAAASARRAGEAVAQMSHISGTIGSLSQAVERIGSVVHVIAEVATQTNLLALNATIEAARAGDSGRGFAVVAAEVKVLATQTSQATVQIADLIKAVQETTARAVLENEQAREQIDHVATIANRLADAVNRQTISAGEIARTAGATATNAATMTSAMALVSESLGQTRAAGGSMLGLSKVLETKIQTFDAAIEALFKSTRERDAATSPLARIMANAKVVD